MQGLLDDTTREPVAKAFQAYNAMEATKRRHFDYLNLLESRQKKFNLKATSDQSALLAALLKDHDMAVTNFKQLAGELKRSDEKAHLLLFQYIGLLNEALGVAGQSAGH